MKRMQWIWIVLSVVASMPAIASPDLAKTRNCMSCHAVGNKVIGPAYRDVAARYAGDAGAEDRLTHKVIIGGKGAWGEVPMPANAQVTEAEARTLVKWILSLK